MESHPLCVWQIEATLGEGPIWVRDEKALYWVDIEQRYLHRLGKGGIKKSWHFAEQITSLAPRARGGFVASIRDGFALVYPDRETIIPIALPEADIPGNRFNDGKVDRQGRFWAGSMDESETATSGALYRLDHDLTLHKMENGYCISNGPTFSPDGATLYHAESTIGRVYASPLRADGTLGARRVFVQLADDEGAPDGMTTDRDGNVWLCHFGGGCVSCFSPSGRRLGKIELPAPNVTSCCFGGDDLETLFITTARFLMSDEQLERYPLAGSLFAARPGALLGKGAERPGVAGLEPTAFAG